jgi:hypothetical protein
MNALAKFKARIASRDVRTSERIRVEMEQATRQLQPLNDAYIELNRLVAAFPTPNRAEPQLLNGKLLEAPPAPAEAPVVVIHRARIAMLEKQLAPAKAKQTELSHELGAVSKTERQQLIADLVLQHVNEDAAVWGANCRAYEAAMIERAARATAIDKLIAADGGQPYLAVGFPVVVQHPDSVNVPTLPAANRAPREIYQLVAARALELFAEFKA